MSIDYQKILLKAKNTNIIEYSVQTGTTEISPSAFINCTQLTNINMEESLYSNIGSDAFPTNCKVNNENTLLSDSCSDSSFSGRIIIPNDVTEIGELEFSNSYGLTSITIPDSVTSIMRQAFYNCWSLTSVTIPSSVTSIMSYAFQNCSGLINIILEDRTLSEAQALIRTINSIGYTGTVTCKDGTYNTTYNDGSGTSGPAGD